ncbi:hypothetical protein RF11_10118 [Thelohanellus kitauei]|uniref:PiggyBac transposable element-derived protein domain-containing protein n=1 Tax=Thelohanellus kitauei TaxID=669202 RepID=A0A0C2N4M7_THEKT|nr:hypothetical protein RF11_10118 [Thelohanellus kitauei]
MSNVSCILLESVTIDIVGLPQSEVGQLLFRLQELLSGCLVAINIQNQSSDFVIEKLIDDYLDKGYTLYMDNFYNSVTLTKLLNTRKTYVCGTLRNFRKVNPKDVVDRKLKKEECIWQHNGPVTVCKWKDKRDVVTISNMHVIEMVEVSDRYGKLSMKPNIRIPTKIKVLTSLRDREKDALLQLVLVMFRQ